MKLSVYTHPDKYPQEAYWINSLLDNGLDYLHIYKPNWDKRRLTALLNEIEFSYYSKVIIHAFDFILEEEPVYGFHFSKKFISSLERPQALLKMNILQGYGHKISLSLPDLQQYDRDFFDYADRVVISPVYTSLSKENHHPSIPLVTYKPFIEKHHDKDFIALGGVTPIKLEELQSLGFNSAAFLSYIWNIGKSPIKQLNQVLEYGYNR